MSRPVQLEDVIFRGQDGKEVPGRGELTRYGQPQRTIFATLYAVMGLLMGLPTLIPGPHMCLTWVFPFVGAFFAWRTWSCEAELTNLEGICPACDAPEIKLPGGQLTARGTLVQMCLKCMVTFEVVCKPAERPSS